MRPVERKNARRIVFVRPKTLDSPIRNAPGEQRAPSPSHLCLWRKRGFSPPSIGRTFVSTKTDSDLARARISDGGVRLPYPPHHLKKKTFTNSYTYNRRVRENILRNTGAGSSKKAATLARSRTERFVWRYYQTCFTHHHGLVVIDVYFKSDE